MVEDFDIFPLLVGDEGGVGKQNREIVGLGDSIAINGVCLTVEEISPPHQFIVVCGAETIATKMGALRRGDAVHLERAFVVGDRLDGHMVQGHRRCCFQCGFLSEGS